jgi:hypothetical protein
MPATFAHPAAVLPFRFFGARWFNFTALVIGSMAPDAGYFVRRFDIATYAHSLSGTVVFCVPFGLLAFSIFHRLRAPLCYLLPEPHRSGLMPLAAAKLPFSARTFLTISVSVLVGAWTHALADSCTHKTGWVVQRVPWMQTTLFHIGAADFPVHQLLQHAGSTLGSLALICSYVVWLRRQPRRAPEAHDRLRDRTRVLIVVGGIVAAIAIALPLGWQATTAFTGYTRLRASTFQAAIYAVQIFVPLVIVAAIILYRGRERRSPDPLKLKQLP